MLRNFGRSRGGFTLLEVLIAGSLLLLLLGLFAQALLPVMRAQSRASARSELTLQAAFALDRLSQDLRLGSSSTVTVRTGPPTDSFPTILAVIRKNSVNPNGAQLWETAAVVYFWDREAGRLRRRSWPPAPPAAPAFAPGRPPTLTSDELLAVAQESGQSGRVLARDLEDFQASLVSERVDLTLVLARDYENSQLRCRMQRTVALRNSR